MTHFTYQLIHSQQLQLRDYSFTTQGAVSETKEILAEPEKLVACRRQTGSVQVGGTASAQLGTIQDWMEAWSSYSTAWDNSYFGMMQFNADLATIGTYMAWQGKRERGCSHSNWKKNPHPTQMTDNNQVGSRLPRWIFIESIFDNRLQSTNSSKSDAPKDTSLISLSPLRNKKLGIKKRQQEVLKVVRLFESV